MDTRLNLALVGFGQFGKKYYKNIRSNKDFFLKTIFRKKNVDEKKFKKLSKKNLLKSKINAAIICTPVKSHFKIAKLFLENRIPMILEKPAANNIKEIKELDKLSKKLSVTVLVNHSDLFNQNLKAISSKIKSIGKIKLIDIQFGKYSAKYNTKDLLPCFDWLPHPLAVIIKLFKKVKFNKIIKNVITKKNKSLFQEILISLKGPKNIDIKIFYSNKFKKKLRKITFYGKKGFINYDGYNDKDNFTYIKQKTKLIKPNLTPMQNILLKFYNLVKQKKFQSDLKLSLEVEKIVSIIRKKIHSKTGQIAHK